MKTSTSTTLTALVEGLPLWAHLIAALISYLNNDRSTERFGVFFREFKEARTKEQMEDLLHEILRRPGRGEVNYLAPEEVMVVGEQVGYRHIQQDNRWRALSWSVLANPLGGATIELRGVAPDKPDTHYFFARMVADHEGLGAWEVGHPRAFGGWLKVSGYLVDLKNLRRVLEGLEGYLGRAFVDWRALEKTAKEVMERTVLDKAVAYLNLFGEEAVSAIHEAMRDLGEGEKDWRDSLFLRSLLDLD